MMTGIPKTDQKTSRSYNLGSATIAFLLWGGWAFYVNGQVISGLLQGTASFVITLLIVGAVTWLTHQLSPRITKTSLRIILSALITVLITGSFLTLAHSLAKTPHIFMTIAPAIIVSFVFSLLTAYKLK